MSIKVLDSRVILDDAIKEQCRHWGRRHFGGKKVVAIVAIFRCAKRALQKCPSWENKYSSNSKSNSIKAKETARNLLGYAFSYYLVQNLWSSKAVL